MNRDNTIINKNIFILSLKISTLKIFSLVMLTMALFTVQFLSLPFAHADGYPPYSDNSTGAIHYDPVPWPSDAAWSAYTFNQTAIRDKRTQDPSNGGTSPQNYVNISSQCADQSAPSVYWKYDTAEQVLFLRFKVEQIPNTYATGPAPGAYSNIDPWKCAQWTVLLDIDGDGYREFAVHIDGCSGLPATPIDIIQSIYSNTPGQSIDFTNPLIYPIYRIAHNPTAFVDKTTNIILNFRNSLSPSTSWPNGSAETVWDYGASRVTNISTVNPLCNEYQLDFQVPLAMLDATSVGGPQFTVDTPFCMAFVTANSNINPLQKDVAFDGTFVGNENSCVPCGDMVTLNGGSFPQPTVDQVTATGCGPTTLTAQVRDTINAACQSSVTTVNFYYYYDKDGDGEADDGGSWTLAGAGTRSTTNPSLWSLSWDSRIPPFNLNKGQYLIGVWATDGTNTTKSYLTSSSPPVYANPSPVPGVVYDIFDNSCGESVSLTKSVSPAYTTVGQDVTFTLTVTNNTSAAFNLTSITDALPSGFSYQSAPIEGGSLAGFIDPGPPPKRPTNGASGNVTWTFSGASIPAAVGGIPGTGTLTFTAQVSSIEGTFSNSASAVTNDPDWGNLSSNVVDIGVGEPQLTIAKRPSAYQAVPGDTITYTITYSNNSPVNATGVVITDILPAGLTFVSADNGGTYNAATRTITWNLGSLASGEGPYTVTYQVIVTQGAAVRTENTATIDSNDTDPAYATTAIYVPSPLQIDKSADKLLVDPRGVSPANQVTYTILYQNTGTAPLNGVTVTDIIPNGFLFVSASSPPLNTGVEILSDSIGDDDGICETLEACSTITWNVGTLAAGASGSVDLTLRVTNPYTGTANPAINTAIIDTYETGPFQDSTSVVIREYDCGATKDRYYFHDLDASGLPLPWIGVAPGTPLPVTLERSYANKTAPTNPNAIQTTVNIIGDSEYELAHFYMNPPLGQASGFSITGTVDMQAYMSKGAGGKINIIAYLYDYNPETGEAIQIGTQAADSGAGNRNNFLLTYSITPSGIVKAGNLLLWRFTTQRDGSYTGSVVFLYDGTSSRAYGDVCFAPLSITMNKTVNLLEAGTSTPLVYTVTFTNSGQRDVTGATILDTLPTGVTFNGATMNSTTMTLNCPTPGLNQYCVSGQAYTFEAHTSGAAAGILAGGGTGTLVINVTTNASLTGITTLTNIARLTTASTDPVEDSATTDVIHTPLPDVFLQKSADKTLLNPGETVTYTIKVVNVGDAAAINVAVSDIIPSDTYFTYVAGSITGGDSQSDAGLPTLTWTVTSLAPGNTATLTFQMQVLTGVPAGVTYKNNLATATEASTSPPDSNTVTVAITTNANIAITKSSNPASSPVNPGVTVQYTMTVTSNGGSTATGVVVTDLIPSGSSYAPGTMIYDSVVQTDLNDGDKAYFDGAANRVVFNPGNMTANPDTSHTLKFSVVLDSTFNNGTTPVTNTVTASATNTSSKQASASLSVLAAPALNLRKSAPALLPLQLTTVTGNPSPGVINVASTRYITAGDHIFWTAPTATEVTVTMVNSPTQITVSPASVPNIGAIIFPTIRYTLTYTNTGNTTATNVKITDVLSSSPTLTYLSSSVTPSQSPAFNANGMVTWELGNVPAGQSAIIQLWVRPVGTGTFFNSANVSSTELSAVPSNITRTQVGAIKLSKSTSTPNVTNSATGTTATYTISLVNESTTIGATGVYVTDNPLPVGFTYASTGVITGGACAYTPRSKVLGTNGSTYACIANHTAAANNMPITGANWQNYWVLSSPPGGAAWVSGLQYSTPNQPIWNNCTINVGGTLAIPFTANIASTVGAGTYQNPVSAISSNMNVLPFDELITTAEDVTVTVPNDLRVTKAVSSLSNPCIAGSCQVVYRVTATNVGTANMTRFTITDVLPTSLSSPPILSASRGQTSYTAGNRTITWTYSDLNSPSDPVFAPNTSETLTITATVNTFSSTIQNCASLFSSLPADTNSGNNTGCADIIPTLVTLSDFRAYEDNGRVVVEWSTSSEYDTAGFYLYRLDDRTEDYIRINQRLLSGLLTSPQGGTYSLIDKGASVNAKSLTYMLVEMEGKGSRNVYGPFTVKINGDSVTGGLNNPDTGTGNIQLSEGCASGNCGDRKTRASSARISQYLDNNGNLVVTNKNAGVTAQSQTYPGIDLFENYIRKAHEMSEEKKARISALSVKKNAVLQTRGTRRPGTSAKISVTGNGLYYLSSAKISELLGIPVQTVQFLIKLNSISLRNNGQDVAYLADQGNNGLYFYGEDIESRYTNENIYWFMKGKGQKISTLKGTGPVPASNGTFTEKLHFEQDKFVAPAITQDPKVDYWFWKQMEGDNNPATCIYPREPDYYCVKEFTIQAEGVSGSASTATLTVNLYGFSDTPANPDHHVKIYVNNNFIGEASWNGQQPKTADIPFDQSLLLNGNNTVKVEALLDTGAPYSYLYINSFDLTYNRIYQASGNALLFRAESNPVVTVDGFTDPDILLLNVTNPKKPVLHTAVTNDGAAENYRISFVPASPDSTYLAISRSAVATKLNAWPDIASNLSYSAKWANYIVITPEELTTAATSLAAYRQSQGLQTMVAQLEDVMDEFNYGIFSPEAIRSFLSYAYKNRSRNLRYAVLMGEGTYDYKNSLGKGDNLMPPLITGTPFGVYPSDNLFVDVNGDHLPDMAIGRFPVLTSEEFAPVLQKIRNYEKSANKRVIMAADNPDTAGSFQADSDDIAGLVPSGYNTVKVYLVPGQVNAVRNTLLSEINAGSMLLNYIGHAGLGRLATEGLLRYEPQNGLNDLIYLTNWNTPPVMTAFTCSAGQFGIPGIDSLAEALLIKTDGGTAAVWSPSGLSLNAFAKILDQGFFASAFGGNRSLGDVILNALREYKTTGSPDFMLDIYVLMGDPALRMR